MKSGKQCAARRRTDRRAGVCLGEFHSFVGKGVNVRRLDFRLSIAADVAIAEIIGKDKHDIRPRSGGARDRRRRKKRGDRKERSGSARISTN
jgi:hypothetical protein